MGFRFRKRIKIAKGVNLNLSKRGLSGSVYIPGTGIGYTTGKLGLGLKSLKSDKSNASDESNASGCGVGCLLIIIVIVTIIIFQSCRGTKHQPATPVVPTPTPQTSSQVPDSTYRIDSEARVKEFLKYPLDAKFNEGIFNIAEVIRNDVMSNVVVRGTVLAKNAFGAELTQTYAVMYDTANETAIIRCVLIIINDQPVWVDEEYTANLDVNGNKTEPTNKTELSPATTQTIPKQDIKQSQEPIQSMPIETVEQKREKSIADAKAALRQAKTRTWTSADGKFKTEATFIKSTPLKITLEKTDGTQITVGWDQLCEEDIEFIKKRQWEIK